MKRKKNKGVTTDHDNLTTLGSLQGGNNLKEALQGEAITRGFVAMQGCLERPKLDEVTTRPLRPIEASRPSLVVASWRRPHD